MALKKCLYCSESISEYATSCPKCSHSEPFNANLKATVDQETASRITKQKNKEDLLNSKYGCPDCGKQRVLAEILKNNTCPSCGFPNMMPRCSLCIKPATQIDDVRNEVVCSLHAVEKCRHCGKDIFEGKTLEKAYVSCCGVMTSVYHLECSSKYRRKKETEAKNTKYSFIFIGAVCVFLLLLKMCTS